MRKLLLLTIAFLLTGQCVWADDIVITNANFTDYFEYNSDFGYRMATDPGNETGGYFLKATVATGSTLDFQGTFLSTFVGENKPRIFINKRVNITSSTKDAVFESSEAKYWTFGIVQGADQTVVKNLQFDNVWVFVNGSEYVTFDGISQNVHDVPIGSGIGGFSVYSVDESHQSRHATIKNSTFTYSNNYSRAVVVISCGGAYATVDNNTISCSGNVANMLYASVFNSVGDEPNFITFTNNTITYDGSGSATRWGLVPCGKGNLIENNTINYAGSCMNTGFGFSADAKYPNIYRNNTINGGSMAVYAYSVVENNHVGGALTVPQEATATNNTVGGVLTLNGINAVVKNNTIYNNVTISNEGAIFMGNVVNGTLTLKNNTSVQNNIITGNAIISTGDYAVYVNDKATNNTIEDNVLVSSALQGDAAVSAGTGTNSIQNNVGGTIITNATQSLAASEKGTYYIVPVDGEVTLNGDIEVIGDPGHRVNILLLGGAELNIHEIAGTGKTIGIYALTNDATMGTMTSDQIDYDMMIVSSGLVTINNTVFAPGVYLNINENGQPGGVVPDDIMTATLTYTRGVTGGTDAWTVCLPYEPPTDNLTYYTLESVSGSTLNFTEVSDPVANTPYLVVTSTDKDFGPLEAMVVNFNAEIKNPDPVDGFQFKGTLRGLSHDNSEGKYILQGNNKWGIVDSAHPSVYIPPFRAYIEVSGNGARLFNSNFGEGTTAIDSIRTINQNGTEQWFDLSGRRIENPTKGLYINNGKKYIKQ